MTPYERRFVANRIVGREPDGGHAGAGSAPDGLRPARRARHAHRARAWPDGGEVCQSVVP